MVTPLDSFGALTGCGVWETDGRRSLHGLGTFRRNLGFWVRWLGSAWRFFCGWTVACWQAFSWYIKLWLQLWRISCQCLFFWNPLLLVVCHWIIRHSWNSMAAPAFELGSEEPWSNKRPWIFGYLWYIYHTYFEYNGSKAIIAIVGYAKSSQLSYYSPILSHNYHHHSPT